MCDCNLVKKNNFLRKINNLIMLKRFFWIFFIFATTQGPFFSFQNEIRLIYIFRYISFDNRDYVNRNVDTIINI